VAANARQAFTGRRCASGLLGKELGIPSRPLRLVKITDGKVLGRVNAGITRRFVLGCTVMKPTLKLSVSALKARLAALLVKLIRVR
jgi:hypothetical protein